MDFWNEQADQLEKALLDNAPALVLHYIRTASPEAVATLAARLDQSMPAGAYSRSA